MTAETVTITVTLKDVPAHLVGLVSDHVTKHVDAFLSDWSDDLNDTLEDGYGLGEDLSDEDWEAINSIKTAWDVTSQG